MLILNPTSGNESANTYKTDISDAIKAKGYELTVKETEKAKDATNFADLACKENFNYVVAAGGDGTINEVINGLCRHEKQPLFNFIPLGTVNDFARAIGIPQKPEEAIDWLKAANHERSVDVGQANDQFFANVVAMGAIAEATHEVTIEQKTKFGSLSYYVEGIKKLNDNKTYALEIEADGHHTKVNAFLVLVGMTNSIAGFENLAKGAELDDGYMHIFIVKKLEGLDIVKVMTSLLKGTFKDQEQVTYIKAKEAKISSKEQLVTNIDGDEGENLPIDFRVKPQHIRLLTVNESE